MFDDMCRRFICFLLCLLLLVFFCGLASAPQEGESISSVQVGDSIPVIVVLRGDIGKLPEHRLQVSAARERVLFRLDKQKFKLKHSYSAINGFSGEVSEDELGRLLDDPDVLGVYRDKRVHAFLPQSVPLINASAVWGLQVGVENITGKGETICIIDTGVDYTHPDLGGCNPMNYKLSGNTVDYTRQSPHPYPDDYDNIWNITQPGFERIAVHFKNFSLEMPSFFFDALDRIYVYDGNMVGIAAYRGVNVHDVWTPSAEGDTIYIRLVSDASVNDYGFYIDRIINGTANQTLNWSSCSKVVGGWDFVNSDSNPWDDEGHGTHCAGIAAANGAVKGVALDARIVAVKALDDTGSGWNSDVIAGIDWCVDNSLSYNISVISMSLGTDSVYGSYCDDEDPPTTLAINAAVARNISVVVASGNGGHNVGISLPACIQNATPVGSVDDGSGGTTADVFSSFTDRDSGFPEMLLAPGKWITSTVPGGGYDTWSGTSMATPHAAGAVALLKQYLRLSNQDRTPQEIEDLFNDTGRRVYDSGTGLYFSRIDIYSTITDLDNPPVVSLNKPLNASFLDRDYSLLNWTCVDPEGLDMTSWVYGDNISANTLLTSNNCSSNVSCSYNWTNLSEGVYYWRVNCKDNLSLTSSCILGFEVDMTAPSVAFTSPTPNNGSVVDFNTIGFNVSHSEANPDTLMFYFNGVAEDDGYSGGNTLIEKILSNGFYNFSVWLNDSAGNVNQTGIRYFTVNATPPTVALVSPPALSFSNGTVNLTCNASDNMGLESVSLYWNYSGGWHVNETKNVSGKSSLAWFHKSVSGEGLFGWNCLACDNSSNCALSPGNLSVTVDTVPPAINSYSINPRVAINGSNVSLSLDVTDSHLNSSWAFVYPPNLSQTGISLPGDYSTGILGWHNVSFHVNDSAGNKASVEDYFVVGEEMVFNSSFQGYNNTSLNVTLRVFFGDSLIAFNQSAGNVSMTLADYVYDLEFSVFNNSLVVFLLGVNLSGNNNRVIGFDILTSVGDYLVTYAVNSSYLMENASLNLSYSGSGYTNSNYLGVYRCASWNFTARNCSGAWEEVNASKFAAGEYFLLNVSGFSAFSVKQEPYCGDGFIGAGEQCDGSNFGGKTCQSYGFDYGSLSCSASCTISTAGCSYSGGGGGGGSSGGGGRGGLKVTVSCFDGIKNCHDNSCEEGIDCGGPCRACPSCDDGVQNQGEQGIDCGGLCKPCSVTTSTTRFIRSTTSTLFSPIATMGSTMPTSTSLVGSTTTLTVYEKTSGGYEGLLVAVLVLAVLVFALHIRYTKHAKAKVEEEESDLREAISGND
ncbi:MAG: S8 family serine peptidase [Candidatus Altiarchaeota archaeon]|nr:S8 family serine peptidase [Candidatus Altiarchaeota archaeon]